MSDPIFDLEEQMLAFASVTSDIELVVRHLMDRPQEYSDDDVMNKFMAIKDLYEIKFQQMWSTFDEVVKEYHERGKK